MFKEIMIILFLLFLVLAAIYLTLKSMLTGGRKKSKNGYVGKNAKEIVTNIISEEMTDDDMGVAEIKLECDRRIVDLDNVVVNRYGVFIIEARNYRGDLYGREEDETWIRQWNDKSGDRYEEEIRNPINQVKRKMDSLTNFLLDNGISVWVDGYVFLVHKNSPVDSQYILWSADDVDYAIHPKVKMQLSSKQVQRINRLLLEY